jgi:hypothetical protein
MGAEQTAIGKLLKTHAFPARWQFLQFHLSLQKEKVREGWEG